VSDLAPPANSASVSTLWRGCAFAQEVSAPSDPTRVAAATDVAIDEIVVTARRQAEGLHDVPVAITAIGGREIADRQIVSLANLTIIQCFEPILDFR
jgi:iron complex outermembrane recepter protein